jgi:hypothetical protein
MALQTVVATQWLSSDHMVNLTVTNVTIALQQWNGVFYAVRDEMF